MTKKAFLFISVLFLNFSIKATSQQLFQFSIQQSQTLTALPAIHSCAFANHNNQWVFIGGRTNGLHGFQPYNGFFPSEMNDSIFVFDPQLNQRWSVSISGFADTILHDCVAAAFNQFVQIDSMLYITGGYGYDQIAVDYITHPYLIAVNLNQLINHVKTGQATEQDFRKLMHPEMAVTGGNLLMIDSVCYLVFGHKFDGRYSEIDTAGFFVQQYSNKIKLFTINDDGVNLSINNYSVLTDTVNFHRRDYNLVPQIFPDRTMGMTAFGGVFQYGINLPFLNPIDIKNNGVAVTSGFSQLLNQYTTATIPVYDSISNAMHTIFLGGIGEYTFDTLNQQYVQNAMVPFVKTISKVSRFSDSSMVEYVLPVEMPDYLGTNAIFIPATGVDLYNNAIINLNALDTGNQLIGYMISGILSTDSNISQISSYLSSANNMAFEVYLNKSVPTGISEFHLPDEIINYRVFPNPFNGSVNIEFENKKEQFVNVVICDASGKQIEILNQNKLPAGLQRFMWHPKSFANQTYLVKITTEKLTRIIKVSNHH